MDNTSIITQVANPKEEEIISSSQEKGKKIFLYVFFFFYSQTAYFAWLTWLQLLAVQTNTLLHIKKSSQ